MGKIELSFFKKFEHEGIIIKPILKKGNDERAVSFPLSSNTDQVLLLKKANNEITGRLNTIQDLWLEDILFSNDEGDLKLPYDKAYKLIQDELYKFIGLPSIRKVKLELISHGNIGMPSFSVEPVFSDIITHNNITCINRVGPYIQTFTDVFLLPKEHHDLIQILDEHPQNNVNSQMEYIAKVKKVAAKVDSKLDNYLENEELLFPEIIDISLTKDNPQRVDMIINLEGVDENQQEQVFDAAKKGKYNHSALSGSGGRKRVVLSQSMQKELKTLEHKKCITGADVPRMVDNPAAFIPETPVISLEDFSKRVKELEIVTYRAQPFISVRESNNKGWFEVETGVRAVSWQSDDIIDESEDLKDSNYDDLINRSQESQEDYIFADNKWIKVDPDEGREYYKAKRELESVTKNGLLELSKLPYVLKIFDNLSNLEYDEQTIKVKRRFIDISNIEDKNPKPILPHVELHDYQKEGYRWMIILDNAHIGGLLADDMGLGKTLQVITFLSYLYERNEMERVLIVAPLTLLENWKSEIDKFTSGLGSVQIHQGQSRIRKKEALEAYDITMTTYETLVRDQLVFGLVEWRVMIVDEAQKIKNSTTMASNVAKAMKAGIRLALTGTPVENGLNELWCIVDFIQPGLLGSYQEFRKRYELPIQRGMLQPEEIMALTDELQNKIKVVYLRRIKEDKLSGLPEKIESKIPQKMDREQFSLYLHIVNQFKNKQVNFFSALSSLMQLSSHPALIADKLLKDAVTLVRSCPKLKNTLDLLRDISKINEKVIIFTKYRKMQNILCTVINHYFSIYPTVINGDVSTNRLGIVKQFEEKAGFNVAILSPRAAGVGLTITGANHVIHYTREWNPAVENQATDRVYRIGQEKDVKVYYPIAIIDNGISVEQRLDELLEEKKRLIKSVIITKEALSINEKDFVGIL